jgi:hypothetical protein
MVKIIMIFAVLGIRISMLWASRIWIHYSEVDADLDPPFLIKVLRGLKSCLQNKIVTQNFSKKLNFLRLKIMCLLVSYKKKIYLKNYFLHP